MNERKEELMSAPVPAGLAGLKLTRIDIVLSSPKLELRAAFAEATAAGNMILDMDMGLNNEITVFFELKSVTHDTKITRK